MDLTTGGIFELDLNTDLSLTFRSVDHWIAHCHHRAAAWAGGDEFGAGFGGDEAPGAGGDPSGPGAGRWTGWGFRADARVTLTMTIRPRGSMPACPGWFRWSVGGGRGGEGWSETHWVRGRSPSPPPPPCTPEQPPMMNRFRAGCQVLGTKFAWGGILKNGPPTTFSCDLGVSRRRVADLIVKILSNGVSFTGGSLVRGGTSDRGIK